MGLRPMPRRGFLQSPDLLMISSISYDFLNLNKFNNFNNFNEGSDSTKAGFNGRF